MRRWLDGQDGAAYKVTLGQSRVMMEKLAKQTERAQEEEDSLDVPREKSWVARVVGEAQGCRLEKKILQSLETFLKSWKRSYLDTAFIYFNFYIILKVIFHLLIAKSWLYSPLYDTSFLFSHSVVSYSLQPHGLQHAKPPCPSPSPGVCLNSCPLSL